MRIGVLEAGEPPLLLQPAFGRYPAMVEHMLGPAYDYAVFDIVGDAPPSPDACDAYVITGASAGVYDDLPWIAPMENFLRAAKGRVPLVGICFGHQLMARAFGGRVEKSAKGWCAGLHAYQVVDREPWMDGAETIAIPASHQDQVVAAPPNARTVLASDFTPSPPSPMTTSPRSPSRAIRSSSRPSPRRCMRAGWTRRMTGPPPPG